MRPLVALASSSPSPDKGTPGEGSSDTRGEKKPLKWKIMARKIGPFSSSEKHTLISYNEQSFLSRNMYVVEYVMRGEACTHTYVNERTKEEVAYFGG